jgi:alanine racemase
VSDGFAHPTRAIVHLDRLAHNVRLLGELAQGRPLWPAVKANAYGHGAALVARALGDLGCRTLCVAHVAEALALREAGVEATFVVLSAPLPEQAEACVTGGIEPVVCTEEAARALAACAAANGREVLVHVKVDTGMGRIGIAPSEAPGFLALCAGLRGIQVRGVMSHLPSADEADKRFSLEQIAMFERLRAQVDPERRLLFHLANSAAVLDLPGSLFDVVRPGISIYGLHPSSEIANPRARELRPVLEWYSRISFLKEVPAGTGLSYGHAYRTERPALIATLPVGYGDGLSRRLSDRAEVLVGGVRCPLVGRITMDQCLVDVTALRGRVSLGDDVVLMGRQGDEEITADELAERLDTIAYEVVTALSARVPRIGVGAG